MLFLDTGLLDRFPGQRLNLILDLGFKSNHVFRSLFPFKFVFGQGRGLILVWEMDP